MAMLSVGDVLYRKYQHEITDKLIIDRVEKTIAVSGNYRFRKEYFDGRIYMTSRNKVSFASFRIETEALKDEFERQCLVEGISEIDFSKFNLSQLKVIKQTIDSI